MTGTPLLDGQVLLWHVTADLTLSEILEHILSEASLPKNPNACILLKPNFNNDLIGLTGNSTDLRVLHRTIRSLQGKGYTNLSVVDGPNLGVARMGADVFRRLGVLRLCEKAGVRCLDVNRLENTPVTLKNGISTRIANLFFEADFLINIPTIKTHAEVSMSCCMKNLMGANIGKWKRNLHRDLAGSIVALGELLPISLNIVDGLVGMEGNGPGDGIPRELNWIVSGADPCLTDAVVARLIGFEPSKEVPYLKEACRQGLLDSDSLDRLSRIQCQARVLRPHPVKRMARLFGHPSLGWLRDVVRPLFDNRLVRPLLYRHRIVQDVYESEEAQARFQFAPNVQSRETSFHGAYCPMQLSCHDALDESKGCIQCGYCYWVCDDGAIQITGNKGYLGRHIARYKSLVENAAKSRSGC